LAKKSGGRALSGTDAACDQDRGLSDVASPDPDPFSKALPDTVSPCEMGLMVARRSSREEGHRRKFLAIIDDTPECGRAVAYAARRARSTGGAIVLLYVVKNSDFQHWLGVGDIMRAEARDNAQAELEKHANVVRSDVNIDAELAIREGMPHEAIRELVDEDRDIAILVLAAGNGKDGPGPLVQSLAAATGGGFPIPVTIIPFGLTDEEIDTFT
jgi:nucleotide-binding universal stress UspA family protein